MYNANDTSINAQISINVIIDRKDKTKIII